MIHMSTRRHGDARRRAISVMGVDFYKGEWMEAGTDPARSPTISLIEQAPHSTLGTHFHRQNQFQLFVHGTGTIGPAGAGTGDHPLRGRLHGLRAAGGGRRRGPLLHDPAGLRGGRRTRRAGARAHGARDPSGTLRPARVHCLDDAARPGIDRGADRRRSSRWRPTDWAPASCACHPAICWHRRSPRPRTVRSRSCWRATWSMQAPRCSGSRACMSRPTTASRL